MHPLATATLWDYVPPRVVLYRSTLLGQFCEPSRTYHNADHLLYMWERFTEIAMNKGIDEKHYGPMAMFILFHDFIYDPRQTEFAANEYASLGNYLAYARKGGVVNHLDYGWIPSAIMKTAHHPYKRVSRTLPYLEALALDLDLAAFADHTGVTRRNGDLIRQEYAHVGDKVFYEGRLKFLGEMLEVTVEHGLFYELGDAANHAAEFNIDDEINSIREKLRAIYAT